MNISIKISGSIRVWKYLAKSIESTKYLLIVRRIGRLGYMQNQPTI